MTKSYKEEKTYGAASLRVFLLRIRRRLRADSLSLLLSALRPRLVFILLFGVFIIAQNACVSEASAASMTLTVPAAISLDVQPTGTFTKSSASSFSAKTDGAWGYDLSIKAKIITDMTNGSAKLTTISKNMTEAEYSTAGNNNTWGFMPSKLNSGANSSYIPASTGGATIEKTSAANASAATSYSITLGAKADSSIASGTYKNTLVLILAANSVSYNITYNCNSGTSCPAAQTGSTTASIVPLSSTKPTRSGYEFKGWCTASTSNESCSGQTLQPGNPYTLANGSNTITLYAMWKPVSMQEWEGCSSLAQDGKTVVSLLDSRDNNVYRVAKLKDGKCWMIDNIRIQGRKLSSSDSDVVSNFSLPTSGTSGQSDNAAYVHVNDLYGGHYSYYAATAGTGTTTLVKGNNASGSICPKGWRLPVGGEDTDSKNEFQKLYSVYNSSSALRATPVPNFVFGGSFLNGVSFDEGSGIYWSSTSYGMNGSGMYKAYDLYINTSSVTTGDNSHQAGCYSVRCVKK